MCGSSSLAPEHGLAFEIAGDVAVGILHEALGTPRATGVLLVVGGPQYRVGSHRQFVLLARRLAAAGFPVLRFDYRGIGDSAGAPHTFENVDDDIRAAADLLVARTRVARIVIWGLCDAASAAMMYAPLDERLAGIVLANPWVHSPQGEARVRLRTYYLGRLANRAFWRKLVQGQVDWRDSLGSLRRYLKQAIKRRADSDQPRNFIARMHEGWSRFGGESLLILSGDDLTAEEFRRLCSSSRAWQAVRARGTVTCCDLSEANHTFSSAVWRQAVEQATLEWLVSRVDRGGA